MLAYIERYGARPERFGGGIRHEFPALDDNPFYVRDYSKCVMCWRCIQVCAEDVQNTYALTWGGQGFGSRVTTAFEDKMPDTTCVFCGNCIGPCPTGALKGKVEWQMGQIAEVANGRWNHHSSLVTRQHLHLHQTSAGASINNSHHLPVLRRGLPDRSPRQG